MFESIKWRQLNGFTMAQKRTHYITIKTKTFVNQIVEILGDFVIAGNRVTFRSSGLFNV